MQETTAAVGLPLLIDVMGGREVFRKSPKTEEALIAQVRDGLPYQALAVLLKALNLPAEFAFSFLGITKRTLQRRQQKAKLDTLESDRVLRLARVFASSISVFGDRSRAIDWLHAENVNLGGQKPLACLDTEIGEQRVMDLLGRIEYGVYS